MPENKPRMWWCGWTAPDDIPEEDMLAKWPDGMEGFCTGSGDECSIWAGGVIAATSEDAWKVVLQCYGESADRITRRWAPEEHADDWTPGDRFPGFTLKVSP